MAPLSGFHPSFVSVPSVVASILSRGFFLICRWNLDSGGVKIFARHAEVGVTMMDGRMTYLLQRLGSREAIPLKGFSRFLSMDPVDRILLSPVCLEVYPTLGIQSAQPAIFWNPVCAAGRLLSSLTS